MGEIVHDDGLILRRPRSGIGGRSWKNRFDPRCFFVFADDAEDNIKSAPLRQSNIARFVDEPSPTVIKAAAMPTIPTALINIKRIVIG